MRFLFFHELAHILFTAPIAFFLYRQFKNWKLILMAFLIVIFLDIDHLFAYLFYAITTSNFSFPFATNYFYGSNKVFVLLHGWEWSPILWLIGKKVGKNLKINGLEWTIFLAFLGHLVVDQFSYTSNPLAYFLTFRMLTGFDLGLFNGL